MAAFPDPHELDTLTSAPTPLLEVKNLTTEFSTPAGTLRAVDDVPLSKTLKTNMNYCMVTNPSSHNLQLAEDVRDWICKQSSTILANFAANFPVIDVVTSRLR